MSARLDAEWQDYRLRVLPVDAPVLYARECRRAFYAGAQALLAIVRRTPAADDAEDLVLIQGLTAELKQFMREVGTGRA